MKKLKSSLIKYTIVVTSLVIAIGCKAQLQQPELLKKFQFNSSVPADVLKDTDLFKFNERFMAYPAKGQEASVFDSVSIYLDSQKKICGLSIKSKHYEYSTISEFNKSVTYFLNERKSKPSKKMVYPLITLATPDGKSIQKKSIEPWSMYYWKLDSNENAMLLTKPSAKVDPVENYQKMNAQIWFNYIWYQKSCEKDIAKLLGLDFL